MRARLSRRDIYRLLCRVAEREYADVVEGAGCDDESARVYFVDGSFLEVWLLRDVDPMRRYAFHWERRHLDGCIYRHDNAPHARWSSVSTFPRHYHRGSEDNVVESHIPGDPILALRFLLDSAREFFRGLGSG